ncbi:C45 family autoproteolytic acyltransferase/hydolase [Nocardiopsis composta]|uniref:Isopenicillin-N N-acyltransferase-like protein n=2 Tax=Nocardiopsis composta TaxID=157465 RepID=A0A7W8QIL8_9ACTN|nr:C45 family peptidase [Nocardiopsis composta]MBB5430924.1 isopenicillin-N N-acyltransferase-like protein [Nocardiopsis composta]
MPSVRTLLRHASAETAPADRGRALGAARAAALHGAVAGYTELFAAHGVRPDQVRAQGERALEATAAWAPGLAEEIAGLAEGAGLEPWRLGALNARTEVLGAAAAAGGAAAGGGECSTSVVLPGGGAPPRTLQTWDWHAFLAGGMLLWTLEPRPGHRVHTFTEAGVVGKIGVNGAGLGVHFNVLRHTADGPGTGVPVHVAARRILDEAATVDQAAEIARSARYSASSVVTVVSFDGERGDARCLELSPAGVAEIGPRGGRLAHTNHFLDPVLARGERATDDSTTRGRLDQVRACPAGLAAEHPADRAAALAGHGDGAGVCVHGDPRTPFHERWDTLATIALDLAAPRLLVHPGRPCTAATGRWEDSSA